MKSSVVPSGAAAATVLAQKFAQVKGVGQVSVGGSALPAVRARVPGLRLEVIGDGPHGEALRAQAKRRRRQDREVLVAERLQDGHERLQVLRLEHLHEHIERGGVGIVAADRQGEDDPR